MKVFAPTQGQTRPTHQGMGYLQAATPDFSGLTAGLSKLSAALEARDEADAAAKDKVRAFDATIKYNAFETGANDMLQELKKGADPALGNFREIAENEYTNYENKFIESLDPEFQGPLRARASEYRQQFVENARTFDYEQRNQFYKTGIDKSGDDAAKSVAVYPEGLKEYKAQMDALIDSADIDETTKLEMKKQNAKHLESIAMLKAIEKANIGSKQYTNELSQAIVDGANELGISPVDFATVISFETGGKFSTSIRGGKNNKHIGLIQFGEAEQKQYGAYQGQAPRAQIGAVLAYLKDRGFKRGMGILDLYSTINAGKPGLYHASDTAAGGTPGSVLDKVNSQMGGHRRNAEALLGGNFVIPDSIDADPQYSNVPYEDRIGLRKQGEANASSILKDQNDQRVATQKEFFNNLMVDLHDGNKGQSHLDEARELGMITDYDDIKKAQDLIDKRNEEGLLLQETQDKLQGKIPWDITDPEDGKRANVWLGKSGVDAIINADEEFFNKTLLPFVQSTHFIPSDAIGMFDAMSRSTNPKQQLYALNALSNLEATEPDAYNAQVLERIRKKVDFWQEHRNIMDEKALSDEIGGRVSIDQRNARERLEVEATKLLTDKDTSGEYSIDSLLAQVAPDTWMPRDPSAQLPGIASARVGMQNEWNTLFKENYIRSEGNAEAAKNLTNKELQRTWGTTDFGGVTVLMKFPPQKAGYKMTSAQIEEQLRSELRINPSAKFQLISDDTTQAEVAAGKPASYLVAVHEDGVWRIQANEKGIIRQWFKKTEAMQIDEVRQFQQLRDEDNYKEMLKRATEAARHSNLTGVPIPKEITDDLQEERARVSANKKALKKPAQGPPSTGMIENAGTLKLLFGQKNKTGVVVPGVDVETLPGYPPPAIGMIEAGNVVLEGRPQVETDDGVATVRSKGFEMEGQVYLLPTVNDGKLLNDNEALSLFHKTGEHLGIFADEKTATAYAKDLSREEGKRLKK